MDLAQLYSLTKLDLSNKNITEIPSEISYLKKLRHIDLSNNHIKNFTELTKLPNLVILNLDKNLISEIPKSINILKNLEILNLDKNMIKDIPMEIGTMYNLRILSLVDNPIEKIPWKLKFDLFSSGLGNTLKIYI